MTLADGASGARAAVPRCYVSDPVARLVEGEFKTSGVRLANLSAP